MRRRQSNPGRRNYGAHLWFVLNAPEESQQIVNLSGAQMFLRQKAKFFLHFGVGHRILEVPAVIFDADHLAGARLQDKFKLAQIEFVLGSVGFL